MIAPTEEKVEGEREKETDRCPGQIAGGGEPQKEDLVTRERLKFLFGI